MILPYIIAGTNMPPEARDPRHGLTGIFSGWDILEYVPELLSELGAHYDNETGISEQLYSALSSDSHIVRLAFMNNDPEACIGYVTDIARSGRHENDTDQMHRGRQLAQLICRDYVSRRPNTYIGHWHYGMFLEEHRPDHYDEPYAGTEEAEAYTLPKMDKPLNVQEQSDLLQDAEASAHSEEDKE